MRSDILVTGASGVIGGAIARQLSEAGYSLHLTSRRPQKLISLKNELSKTGARIITGQADLSNWKSCQGAVDRFFRQANRPYGLICNAGNMGTLNLLWKTPFPAWKQAFEENFLAHVAMIQRFAAQASKRRVPEARIVVLSGGGVGGTTDFAYATSYNTAKAALVHLTEAIAEELKPLHITINAIAPGSVLSSMTDQALRAGSSRAGSYAKQAKACRSSGGVSPYLTAKLIAQLLEPRAGKISGRLLSARFDQDILSNAVKARDLGHPSLYRLRRIDNELFRGLKS